MSDTPPGLEARAIEMIRALRESNNWSQSELARRMAEAGWPNYTQMTVSRTEKGERPLRLDEVATLAKVFQVTMSDLWADDDEHMLTSAREDFDREQSTLLMAISRFDDVASRIAYAADNLAAVRPLEASEVESVRDALLTTPAELFWLHRVENAEDRRSRARQIEKVTGHPAPASVLEKFKGEFMKLWEETYVASDEEVTEFRAEQVDDYA